MNQEILEVITGDRLKNGDLVFGLFPVHEDYGYSSDSLDFRVSLCLNEKEDLNFVYWFSDESFASDLVIVDECPKLYHKFPSSIICEKTAHVFIDKTSSQIDNWALWKARQAMRFDSPEQMKSFYQRLEKRHFGFEMTQIPFIRLNRKFLGSITKELILKEVKYLIKSKDLAKMFRYRISNYWALDSENTISSKTRKVSPTIRKAVLNEIAATIFNEYETLFKDQSLLVLTQTSEVVS